MTIDLLIMKKLRIFFWVALATMVIACSSDYEYYAPEIEIPEEPTEAIYFTEDELLVLMQMRNPNNRICIEEATEIALDALDFFGAETNTRSGQMRSIAGVTALRGEPATRIGTRSADGSDVQIQMPDTVAFVFNFADDAGFTIVAADTRITSRVLAFVEDGNLDLNEELDHPGLEIFFTGLEEYIEYSIVEAEQLRESLLEEILAKMNKIGVRDTIFHDDATTRGLLPPPPGGRPSEGLYFEAGRTITITETPGAWSTVERVGPLLPVEWGQGFPFNHLVPRLCSSSPDGRAPAGCVATAAAMLMAYWEYPEWIDGFFMDWRLMNRFTARTTASQNAYDNVRGKRSLPRFGDPLDDEQIMFRDNVARLMERIGAGVSMNYGCDGSNTSMQRVVNFLHRIGYRNTWDNYFCTSKVINSLNMEGQRIGPVLASGYRSRTLGINHNGHAWIIDGHLRRSREVLVTVTTAVHMEPIQIPGEPPRRGHTVLTTATHIRHELSSRYLHNNWGFNGRGNGFFVAGSFHVGDRRHYSDTRGAPPPLEDRNYRYGNRIFLGIRP